MTEMCLTESLKNIHTLNLSVAMTEEEAIEYLIQKDIDPSVWRDYKGNRTIMKIVPVELMPLVIAHLETHGELCNDYNLHKYKWRCQRCIFSDVPSDRNLEDAWTFNGDAVEIDMAAARNIHKDNLRAERAPRLEALDVSYMKALEAGSGADAIATQKQNCRRHYR